MLLLAVVSFGAAIAAAADPRPPNIVFIMADDLGWGDLRCFNVHGRVPTPHIDALARAGMMFTDAHTTAALCAPTRYSVITGNYPWRGRRPGGTWRWDEPPQFLEGQLTSGHLLAAAGYRTALLGKLHFGGVFVAGPAGGPDLSRPMVVGPKQWGFSSSCVLLSGHQRPPYCFFEDNLIAGDPARIRELPAGPLNGGLVPFVGPGLPEWDSRRVGEHLLDKAIAVIDEQDERPFFIHFSADGVHVPWTPPDALAGTPVKGASGMTARTDMVVAFDIIVGNLVAAIERRGLLEQTLIIVTSDNGAVAHERDEHGHDALGGLRGWKTCISEGGHRVPLIASWKGRIAAGQIRRQLIGVHDVVPTFVDLAGGPREPDQMLDAVSLAPVLLGKRGDDQPVRETLLIQSQRGRDAFDEFRADMRELTDRANQSGSGGRAHALRAGPWKLVFDIQANAPVALYNLDDDLGERTNLIGSPEHRDRIEAMDRRYREIRSSPRSTPPLGPAVPAAAPGPDHPAPR